jgi:hypothetical protein
MEVRCLLHVPATFYPGKSHWYPLSKRLGKPQNQTGRFGEEKNILPVTGLEPWPSMP